MIQKLEKVLQEAIQTNAKPKSSIGLPAPLQHVAAEIRERYGEAHDFLVTFSKDIQPAVAGNPERAYLGTAPSLTKVRQAYNDEVLVSWLMAQLENLNDFSGANQKMTLVQMEETARMIMVEYHYLKVTEIHLFLHRLKAGRYIQFYGSVDPMKIMEGLTKFSSERILEISYYERKRRDAEFSNLREKWAKECVSREEYERMKAAKQK